MPEPVDLVLLGIPDAALAPTLEVAAARGDAGAVVYGPAYGVKEAVVAAAGEMALVGGGCMGFVDLTTGVRAIGYLERDPLPVGSIALVTHSGSVFSAMLRTHRRLEYSVVVSLGAGARVYDRRPPRLRAVAARDPGRRAGARDHA